VQLRKSLLKFAPSTEKWGTAGFFEASNFSRVLKKLTELSSWL
jgi:hypothetical protein